MSDPVTPTQGAPASPEKPATPFEPITSQEVLNHIIQDRLSREKAKYADYDAIKQKADAFDAAEAEKLNEIQKAEKRAQDAEAERDRIKLEKLRLEVASEKGVPAVLLTGSTKEELEAAADGLISWRGAAPAGPTGPKPNPQQGQPSETKRTGRAAGAAEVAKRFGKTLD